MPGDVTLDVSQVADSLALVNAIADAGPARCAATVVGYGRMGQAYVAALEALRAGPIRVCVRTERAQDALRTRPQLEAVTGGFERLASARNEREIGIVAVPIESLAPAAAHLAACGFRRLLIEKPVALSSGEIERLADRMDAAGSEAFCAFNRIAYPSLQELRGRIAREGGATSCVYTMTERVQADWTQRFSRSTLQRWGVANSLHVLSMAHAAIGMPLSWQAHRAGSLDWHPAGSVFVGSGLTERGVPFAYHADWESTGRWSVEVHTRLASYRLCPMERLAVRHVVPGEWEEVPLAVASREIKAGLLEQVAALAHPSVRALAPLMTLRETARLVRFAESVFGYEERQG